MPTTTSNKRQKTANKKISDAASHGDVKTAAATTLKKGSVVDVTDLLALFRVSEAGHLADVQACIRAGADVNVWHSIQSRAATALQVACMHAHSTEVVRELLDAGANVDTPNWCGLTAFLIMLDSTHYKSKCRVPITRLLLDAKCDVNLRVRDLTALFLACEHDIPIKIFTMIVAAGADLTTRDSKGNTALHDCIFQLSSLGKIKCLLKNGIDVNAKNKLGETALHRAAAMDTKVIPLLLRYNADILATTNENSTALMEVLR